MKHYKQIRLLSSPRFSLRARVSFAVLLAVAALGIVGGAGTGVVAKSKEHRAHLSSDLVRHKARGSKQRVRVIVRGTRAEIEASVDRHQVRVVKWLKHGAVLRANSAEIEALEAELESMSGDTLVAPSMSVSTGSTAADQTKLGTTGIGSVAGVTGYGIGVAVVDSGISLHDAVKNKIVRNVSFVTGDSNTNDPYGHGTHVAGIIAGNGSYASGQTSLYTGGVAPGVHLINVRVLNGSGAGYTSDVIEGIDWVIANRTQYNIRVINLSLGHPVMEPAATDPLCQAVARAVAAGIVVVAAAGNAGQTAGGVPVLGGIISPGNSPYAVTVGSLNTLATVPRGDDVVALSSSRGPTRFDFAVKPDLVAPGHKIVSLEAKQSYLSLTYPFLHRGGSNDNAYMQLSGSSMAAPIVSGAVAMLLEGTPTLGTTQVKMALQAGATHVPDGGLMAAGAGSLNILASRKLAAYGLSALANNLANTVIGGLLATPNGAFFWDAGTMSHRVYTGEGVRPVSGPDLLAVWANPSLLIFGDLYLASLLNPPALVPANGFIWGVNGTTIADEIIWGSNDEIIWGSNDEIIWGSSDEIIWGSNDVLRGTSDILTAPEPQ